MRAGLQRAEVGCLGGRSASFDCSAARCASPLAHMLQEASFRPFATRKRGWSFPSAPSQDTQKILQASLGGLHRGHDMEVLGVYGAFAVAGLRCACGYPIQQANSLGNFKRLRIEQIEKRHTKAQSRASLESNYSREAIEYTREQRLHRLLRKLERESKWRPEGLSEPAPH